MPFSSFPHADKSSGEQRRAPVRQRRSATARQGLLAEPRCRRLGDLGPCHRLPRSVAIPPHTATPPPLPPSSASPTCPPPCIGRLHRGRAARHGACSRSSCDTLPPRVGGSPERAASPASFVDRARPPPLAPMVEATEGGGGDRVASRFRVGGL
jgi:hypothetical protein